jgi:hypothetical protein
MLKRVTLEFDNSTQAFGFCRDCSQCDRLVPIIHNDQRSVTVDIDENNVDIDMSAIAALLSVE